MRGFLFLLPALVGAVAVLGPRSSNDECSGYKAINVKEHDHTLEADLVLNDWACNSYGTDLQNLKLLVEYQTGQYLDIPSPISLLKVTVTNLKQTTAFM